MGLPKESRHISKAVFRLSSLLKEIKRFYINIHLCSLLKIQCGGCFYRDYGRSNDSVCRGCFKTYINLLVVQKQTNLKDFI